MAESIVSRKGGLRARVPTRPVVPRENVILRYIKAQRNGLERDTRHWVELYRQEPVRKQLIDGPIFAVVNDAEVHEHLGGAISIVGQEKPLILISSYLTDPEQRTLAQQIFQEWTTAKTARIEQTKRMAERIRVQVLDVVKKIELQLTKMMVRVPLDGKFYSFSLGRWKFKTRFDQNRRQYETSIVLDQELQKLFNISRTSNIVFVYKLNR